MATHLTEIELAVSGVVDRGTVVVPVRTTEEHEAAKAEYHERMNAARLPDGPWPPDGFVQSLGSKSLRKTQEEVACDAEGWTVVEHNHWWLCDVGTERNWGAIHWGTWWAATGFGVTAKSTKSPEQAVRNGRATLRRKQR